MHNPDSKFKSLFVVTAVNITRVVRICEYIVTDIFITYVRTHLCARNGIWQTSTWRPTSAFDARSRILVHIISHILPEVVGCPQCFNHIPEEMVLPGMGLSSSAHISDWKFALLPAGMRVSCGWQPLFEYLFCCKQRPSKFRKTGFFKSVKATSNKLLI